MSIRPGFVTRLKEGLQWRVREYRSRLEDLFGVRRTQWIRVVMDRATDEFVRSLPVDRLHALEISGTKWRETGFATYRSVSYPEYDVCAGVVADEAFDIIIAEQVLEHVLWPYRAVKNIYRMLRPGGVFVVTTPFLVRKHAHPIDCCRWTELGMKHLLAEGGFPIDEIQTGSWGNRKAVRANFNAWKNWVPWLHSLKNEPDFPVVVWGFAWKR
jgi:SAM-dependent methyltransferase